MTVSLELLSSSRGLEVLEGRGDHEFPGAIPGCGGNLTSGRRQTATGSKPVTCAIPPRDSAHTFSFSESDIADRIAHDMFTIAVYSGRSLLYGDYSSYNHAFHLKLSQ